MKISFFSKILVLLTVLSIVPLIIFGLIIIRDFDDMEKVSVQNLKAGTSIIIRDSTKSLDDLGTTIIKNQALAVKKLVEQYLRMHPGKTAAELIADAEFQAIAIQPVGIKGYTAVIQTKTQNMIAHPNKELMGRDLLGMKDEAEMQDWWRIVETTWRDNKNSFGYYKWPEPDGTYGEKYMYLAVIDAKLENGIDLSVAATTYINEFNGPVEMLAKQMEETEKTMVNNIDNTARDIQNKAFVFIVIIACAVLASGFFFALSITRPIKKLRNFSKEIGERKAVEVKIDSNDEFSELGECFNRMAKDIEDYQGKLEKSNMELEDRIKDRTKELEDKNSELEKFNKMAVDRELTMIGLKKQIKELKNSQS